MSTQEDRGRPTLVDNLDWSHDAALRVLLERDPGGTLRIATGYASLSGLDLLARTQDARPLRLLLGAVSAQPSAVGVRLAVRQALAAMRSELAAERDVNNFPPARRAAIERVRTLLDREDVDVRRYLPRFLHGKAFVVGSEATLVGSANLTAGGLIQNLELGIVDYNEDPNRRAVEWFEARWAEETEDAKPELLELLEPPPADARPFDVFLRALEEFFGEEPTEERRFRSELELARFQRDGHDRARAIAERFGGVLYADGTGLGKTFIGLRFLEEASLGRGEHTLAIVPAQLEKSFWGAAPAKFNIPFEIVTHDELALDAQLGQGGTAQHLKLPKDSYRLIMIDEAQAFRNPATKRYKALDKLLGDVEKRVVLLSATPVNNSLWDIYWLLGLFARSEQAFASEPLRIADLKRFFIRSGANDPDQLSPTRLFRLLSHVAVSRPRRFIEQYYEGDTIDGELVRFPTPTYRTERYTLDDVYHGLFGRIVDALGRLRFARYQPARYLTPEARARLGPVAAVEAAREISLAGLLLSGLLKRFESSHAAAYKTVRGLIRAHEAFLAAWGAGWVPPPEALKDLADTEGDIELALVEQELETVTEKRARTDYDERLARHVEADCAVLRDLLEEVGEPDPDRDPKVHALRRLVEEVPAGEKVIVFASFADTVGYLDDAIDSGVDISGGREHVTIVGRDTQATTRVRLVARFAPETAGLPGTGLPPGDTEVDFLLSTDVLAEGQNLQQAAYLVNFDLTWNPQRMVQRAGRINRLGGREKVAITTLAPNDAELERLLRLEARISAKVKAANAALGMEAQILDLLPEERLYAGPEPLAEGEGDTAGEDAVRRELQAEARGGEGLERDVEEAAGAAAERYRLALQRARDNGDIERIRRLPWGAGCAFVQGAGVPSRGATGVFFATRVRSERVWRYVTAEEVLRDELPMLQAIEPGRDTPSLDYDVDQVVAAWERAEADILQEWNEEPVDEPTIPAAQQWALDVLSRVRLPVGTELEAAATLRVARRQPVVRALSKVRRRLEGSEIGEREAGAEIVEVVGAFGLRPAEQVDVARDPIEPEDIAVVCYSMVLAAD